jgi:signal transduction histidine kinase
MAAAGAVSLLTRPALLLCQAPLQAAGPAVFAAAALVSGEPPDEVSLGFRGGTAGKSRAERRPVRPVEYKAVGLWGDVPDALWRYLLAMSRQVGRLRWPRGGRPPFDVLLAVGLAALSLQLVATAPGPTGAPAYVLTLLHTLPLAVRRRFPYGVLATSVASGLAVAMLGLPPVFLGVAILVPVYTVAAYRDPPGSLVALAVVEAAVAVVQLTPGATGVVTWLGNTLVLTAAWLLGHFVHDRRVYAGRLEERTAQLEEAREELARRAVAEERLRIARELHDVVAHSMSVIAVQSGVGAHVAATQPEEARKALAAIEVTSRTTLNELRRLLGVLREDGEPRGSLAPVPGLAGLDALLAQMSEAGLAVRLRVEGARAQVPAGIDLSAYRIVQEALTNVLKHAGAARAQVVIGYGEREITIEVTDDGRGATARGAVDRAGTGHGLIGLRERVALFGGELEVGPRPGSGFRVAARLPFETGPP